VYDYLKICNCLVHLYSYPESQKTDGLNKLNNKSKCLSFRRIKGFNLLRFQSMHVFEKILYAIYVLHIIIFQSFILSDLT